MGAKEVFLLLTTLSSLVAVLLAARTVDFLQRRRMLRRLQQVHPLVASPLGSSVRKPNLVREYSHFSPPVFHQTLSLSVQHRQQHETPPAATAVVFHTSTFALQGEREGLTAIHHRYLHNLFLFFLCLTFLPIDGLGMCASYRVTTFHNDPTCAATLPALRLRQ